MADDQDGTVIIGDHFLQQVERFEIQIVGRLVEDQQVRAPRKFTGQQEPRAFAARQRADERIDDAGIEQELLQIPDDMLLDAEHFDPVAAVGEHLAHGFVRSHQAALLVDDDTVERLGERDRAAVGREFAGEQLEQRRLARTVCTDDADAITALDTQCEVLDDRPVAE